MGAQAHKPSQAFLDMVPKLDGENHKGQHGKVCVIGGNVEFTGAPFYSAFSAMQTGADYGNVFCTAGAAVAIKSYAPELIVHPCMLQLSDMYGGWREQDISYELQQAAVEQAYRSVEPWIKKATCLVVGPGLGKDPVMIAAARDIMLEARSQMVPFVVDADGIGVVIAHPETVQGYNRAVLTPNTPEFWRLADALNIDHAKTPPHEDPGLVQLVADTIEGPTIVAKGPKDSITSANAELVVTSGQGCPRRCGGLGDILSGVLATTVSWAVAHSRKNDLEPRDETQCIQVAALHASELVRLTQASAYAKRGRSMVARDVVNQLCTVVHDTWPS